jgi:hypothetical protein
MCFSATASFVAAGTVGVIGIATLRKATLSRIRPLALLPIFFSVQQCLEGFVWITLNLPRLPLSFWEPFQYKILMWHALQAIGIYGYVFFAGIFWPVWIPYALSCVEENNLYRRRLTEIMIVNVILGVIYVVSWHFAPIIATDVNCHLAYSIFDAPLPWLNYTSTSFVANFGLKFIKILTRGLYLLGSTMSFFYSSLPHTKMIGALSLAAYVIAGIGYQFAFASVWCFFAAAISVLTYYVVVQYQKQHVSQ